MELNIKNVFDFVSKDTINSLKDIAIEKNEALHLKNLAGNEFLGWVDLPSLISDKDFIDIETKANEFKKKLDILVVIGIGGSYLGAKAIIESLSNSFSHLKKDQNNPLILFAGQNISEDYLFELKEILNNYSFGICVISKSGTTTEPAIAFRVLRQLIEEKYGKEEARKRIVAITDKEKGALRKLSDKEGYKTYIISDDIGGRFSVLTPVGLFPIAVAGFDIRQLIKGAVDMQTQTSQNEFDKNPAALYAATRYALYQNNMDIEILVNYHPKLQYFSEWWKQLYGESEGKGHKGLFPASVNLTTDLHSLGQYIQDGKRILFETVLSVENANHNLEIPKDEENLDKLNYIAGERINEVNKKAELGTTIAHIKGKVPNIQIVIEKLDEYNIGQLIYFFEKACGISGYMLEVNPFDQPGVEDYKRNMFALLGKPGFEEERKKIEKYL